MTQTQLMAIMLNQLLAHVAYLPHIAYGVNVGQCPFCHVTGELHYGAGVTYQHMPACAFTLNDQLQQSLRDEVK
jgi:tetrahydromethanopterin S-methyltransferase subunit E